MAFSQKHSGKILVPWFNAEEWRCVYGYLTSNIQENLQNALEILKLWKLRTPLLSAGIEGTLILLEAILTNVENLSEFQLQQIYSVSLLRFLNICAANNDRQGTFNKTASKNDLLKWLIDIRHNIAHSPKLPSKSMLELALTNSLQWVLEKYWTTENKTISDYVVDVCNDNTKIVDAVNAYIRLSLNLYKDVDMNEYDEALMEKINYLVSKRHNRSRTDSQGLLIILEELMKQVFSEPQNQNMAGKVAEILADKRALFATHLETNEEGEENIPKTFKDVWSNLLNILFENQFLTALLNQLVSVTTTATNEAAQKIACIWICDILNGLLKLQSLENELENVTEHQLELDSLTNRILSKSMVEKNNPKFKNCIEFESLKALQLINLRTLEKNIVDRPNVHCLKFLDKVMVLNKYPQDYANLITTMVSSMCHTNCNLTPSFSTIFNVNDLPVDIETLKPSIPLTNGSDFPSIAEDVHVQEEIVDAHLPEEIVPSGRRWTRVRDTSLYKGFHVGVLSRQKRPGNPLLI